MNTLQWLEQKLNYQDVEKLVTDREGSYAGLAQEALLTSPQDFYKIFQSIPQAKKYIELGSGHGVGPLIYHDLYPDSFASGIEFELARVDAANRLKDQLQYNKVEFFHADLLSCEIPDADLYFLYFPTGPVLDRVLDKLGKNVGSFSLIAIESHGDLFDRLDQEEWLVVTKEIPLQSLRHSPFARIYSKRSLKNGSFHDFSFQDLHFKILREDGRVWLGDSLGMTWLQKESFNLLHPPATFQKQDVLSIHSHTEFDENLQLLIKLRRLGSLEFVQGNRHFIGTIRKIFIYPGIEIELSTGEILKLDNDQIKTLAATYAERLK